MSKENKIQKDNKYNIIINEKFTYINNYKKIINLSDNEIYIELNNFNLKITGKNIKVKKLVEEEVKFDGLIESINYYYK